MEFVTSLFYASVSGAVLVSIVLILRALKLQKLPKRFFVISWWLCSLWHFIALALGVFAPVFVSQNKSVKSILPIAANEAKKLNIVLLSWLIGAFISALILAVILLRSKIIFRQAIPDRSHFCSTWLESHNLKRKISVKTSDRIDSPLTYGFVNPVILLPANQSYCEEELLFILEHEFVHIKRLDALLKAITSALVCIFWFSPWAWAMFVFSSRDMELACDEEVIKRLGESHRTSYAMALVRAEERKLGLKVMSFAGNSTEERVKSLMKVKKNNARRIILSAILSLVLIVASISATIISINNRAENEMRIFSPVPESVNSPSQFSDYKLIKQLGSIKLMSNLNNETKTEWMSVGLAGSPEEVRCIVTSDDGIREYPVTPVNEFKSEKEFNGFNCNTKIVTEDSLKDMLATENLNQFYVGSDKAYDYYRPLDVDGEIFTHGLLKTNVIYPEDIGKSPNYIVIDDDENLIAVNSADGKDIGNEKTLYYISYQAQDYTRYEPPEQFAVRRMEV